MIRELKEDLRALEKDCRDEEKVLKSHWFSFYRGAFVVRTGWKRSGTLGVIFLSRRGIFLREKGRGDSRDLLRHEYGHWLQGKRVGFFAYLFRILLPSAWSRSPQAYYDRPWEITADALGGAEMSPHSKEDLEAGFAYLERITPRRRR